MVELLFGFVQGSWLQTGMRVDDRSLILKREVQEKCHACSAVTSTGESPKRRGPKIDPNIFRPYCKDTDQKKGPIHRKSHLHSSEPTCKWRGAPSKTTILHKGPSTSLHVSLGASMFRIRDFSQTAPPNYPLRCPKYHPIETIRPLIEIQSAV